KSERRLVHGIAEVADENSRKQHARRAEPDAANLQASKRHAEHAHAREGDDRVRGRLRLVEVLKPAHLNCYPMGAAAFTPALGRLRRFSSERCPAVAAGRLSTGD